MTTIDQRTLIPIPADTVWAYISDINNNPRWQVDSESVVFLTSRRAGPGLRWRNVTNNSSEQVIEITAWYDGLGYQYTYIDGVPYRTSSGTLRLQETPDGTVVQWTFNYELGGVLGGMRNSMGIGRRVERVMADSLKGLWREMREASNTGEFGEAKSLMRPAPDAEARAQYKPRHPSRFTRERGDADLEPETTETARTKDRFAPSDETVYVPSDPAIPEPPVAEDDTRPNRPVTVSSPAEADLDAPEPFVEAEPDFLEAVPDAPELADPFADAEPDFMDPDVPDPFAGGEPDFVAGSSSAVEHEAEPDFLDSWAPRSTPDLAEPPLSDEDTRPNRPVMAEPTAAEEAVERADAEPLPDADEARFAPTDDYRTRTAEHQAQSPLPDEDGWHDPNLETSEARATLTDEQTPLELEPDDGLTSIDLPREEAVDEAALADAIDRLPDDDHTPSLAADAPEAHYLLPKTPPPPVDEAGDTDVEASPGQLKPAGDDETLSLADAEADEADQPEPSSLTEPPPITGTDTATISIWEVFGVERPSDAPRTPPLTTEAAEPPPVVANTPLPEPRMGLRRRLRRRRARLRYPD